MPEAESIPTGVETSPLEKKYLANAVWDHRFQLIRRNLSAAPDFCRDCEYAGNCRGDAHHSWDFDRNRPMLCFRDLLF